MQHHIAVISLLVLLGGCGDKDATTTAANETAQVTEYSAQPDATNLPQYQNSLAYLDINAVNVLVQSSKPSNPAVTSAVAVDVASKHLSLLLKDTLVAAATHTEDMGNSTDHVEVYSDTANPTAAKPQLLRNNNWSSLEELFKISDTELLAVGRQKLYHCPVNAKCKPTSIRNPQALSLTWFELNPQSELQSRGNLLLNSEYLAAYQTENVLYVVSRTVPDFINSTDWEDKEQPQQKAALQQSGEQHYLNYRSRSEDTPSTFLPATRGCYTSESNAPDFELGLMTNITAFALDSKKLIDSVCVLDEISAVSLADNVVIMQAPNGEQHQFALPLSGVKYLGSL